MGPSRVDLSLCFAMTKSPIFCPLEVAVLWKISLDWIPDSVQWVPAPRLEPT